MADQPKKVGVYDTTDTTGTTGTSPKTDVKVERSAGGSKALWWIVGLVILAVIIALFVL